MPDHLSGNSDQVNNLFFSTAELIQGSKLPELELLTAAAIKYPERKVCIPTHWVIIDILTAECDTNIIPAGMKPVVIYSSPPERSVDKRDNNGFVSDYQIAYDGCFFETNSIIYILTGTGFRQSLSAKLVRALGTRQPN